MIKGILFPRSDIDRKRHTIYMWVMLVLMGILIGLVSLVLAASIYGMPMFWSYFRHPLVLLLNLLPPLLLILLFYCISGRAWIAWLVSSVLVLLPTAINFYKIQLRSDPFMAADISLFSEAQNILSSYTVRFNGRVAFAGLVIVLGLLFAIFLMKGKPGIRTRIIGTAAGLITGVLLYCNVYTNDNIYHYKATNNDLINEWVDTPFYISHGFVYPFLHSIPDAFPTPPDGYDSTAAAEALAACPAGEIPEDRQVNVITVMLEAYGSPETFDGINFTQDIYGPFEALQAESLSGSLVTNVFAGNTINTERAFLTGYTYSLSTFRRDTTTYVRYLREQGYYTEGYHSGDGWFYNRQNVSSYFGFHNYYFLENFQLEDRSDACFFSKVAELYDARDPSVPYFSYNLSYQNHGSYPEDYTVPESYVSRDGLTESSYNILNNYFSGIYDTNIQLAKFIDGFRDDSEPVVILVFGDHMPWLGNGNSVYTELGINIDTGTEEGFYNYYSTPYIIWANDAAKAVLDNDFAGAGDSFSPCFLMNELFDQCGWTGNEYMQISNQMRTYTDVIHADGIFRVDEELAHPLHGEALDYWTLFNSVIYYQKHNL